MKRGCAKIFNLVKKIDTKPHPFHAYVHVHGI